MAVRTLRILAAAAAIAAAIGVPASAGDGDATYDCGLVAVDDSGAPECGDDRPTANSRAAAANCRLDVEAFFWAGSDWLRLAQALAADPLPCGDYHVSIPPLANNKTALRVAQDDLVRNLGVHPVAEVNLGEATGWANWARANGESWFEAGVEFRRRMAAAGYDPAAGETWVVNELDYTTVLDSDRGPNSTVPPYRRADVRDLLRGLYVGAPGMEPLPGIVLLGIPFRHQNLPDVEAYRRDLQGFLADSAFWSDIDSYVRWLGVEVYADTRLWGVHGSSLNERRHHLEDYVFHMLELARTGPEEVAAAGRLLEEKFLPLGNAIWRARGGEPFAFAAGAGNTIVDDETMRRFVSEQVYAIRHNAGSRPHGAPAGRIGFAWQPCNRLSAAEAGCRPQTAEFVAGLDSIAARLAESIHYAYRQGGASPVGACGPPGGLDWCDGAAVAGASFTDAWAHFRWSSTSPESD
jgi:hypothetical protein